jgi:archaetidylinositol phosphate synthase
MVSASGIILAFLSATTYSLWQGNASFILLATALLLFSGYCDALDGVVARLYKQTTVFGGFLDSLLDRYADAAVYIGIIIGGLTEPLWGFLALTGSLLVSYTRARAEAAGIKMETVGFAERAERIIILALASIIAFFWQPVTVMTGSIILLAILSNLTVIQRSLYAYNELKRKETN